MISRIKVASSALNQTPLDWYGNRQRILDCIKDAQEQSVSILCLPELCLTGYGCEDQFYAPDTREQAWQSLEEIVAETSGITVTLGLPMLIQNKLYNAVAVVSNKRILGFVAKQHLPNYGVFYEDRWFHRWPANARTEYKRDGFSYPFGDIQFELSGVKIGLEICEDAWVPARPGRTHFDKGIDILLNPSASPFSFGKFRTRERLVQDASRSFSCAYIYANLLGNESGRLIFDGDALIAQDGQLLASSDRFSYEDYTLITAWIDISVNQQNAMVIKTPFVSEKPSLVSTDFDWPEDVIPHPQQVEIDAFEKGIYIKEEEFTRAVSLGLFDYLRKSRANGFTLSLSGGADSSACLALCAYMVLLAEESIGLSKLKQKLHYIPTIAACQDTKAVTKTLIQTIYQGTKNSSTDTLLSAKNLAEGIGAVFFDINIDSLVAEYTTLIEKQLNRSLSWDTDDIALQNIQARVRAPSVWLLTNTSNHLLLATSNRSEVAVGYCTMDGDTAGSISPISGIDKHWLRHWLRWAEEVGVEVRGTNIPIPSLSWVNKLAPTAELRPLEKVQTDEADLMPYECLDALEKWAIKQRKSPIECYKLALVSQIGSFTEEQWQTWVRRFFQLWSRNQWKRERYAPGFHLDDRNLDPRSWCRFPILSGGFEKELADFTAYLAGQQPPQRRRIGF